MLTIDSAYRLFDEFATQPELLNGEKRILHGIILSNEVHKSFGKTYFRINIKAVANFYLWHEKSYISYRIADNISGQELVNECETVLKQLMIDVIKLKTYIHNHFPDLCVLIFISGHDFIGTMKHRYVDELMLTGEPRLQLLEPMNTKTSLEFERLEKYYADSLKFYHERKICMENYQRKMEFEEKEYNKHLARIVDEHRANQKNDFGLTKERLSRMEQQALKFGNNSN